METHQRYLIWRRAKSIGVEIPSQILDFIDDQYFSKLVSYRIINVVIGAVALVVWWLLSGTKFEKWTFLITTILFILVNIWQWGWSRYMLFRLRKDRGENVGWYMDGPRHVPGWTEPGREWLFRGRANGKRVRPTHGRMVGFQHNVLAIPLERKLRAV